MNHALLFTFAAAMGSHGAIAVGERRPSWDRPGKSQVIGLLAGALGIEREDEAGQSALADGLFHAVRVDHAGQALMDYHTTQVPPQRRNRTFATRAAELAVPKQELKTILSRREYRTGSCFTIAVWYEPANQDALQNLAAALTHPAFVPYAGRKSCPLMLPLSPHLVCIEDGIEDAFKRYDVALKERTGGFVERILPRKSNHRRIYIDVRSDLAPTQLLERIEERRDVPESRTKWRFGLRSEALLKRSNSDEEAASND